MVTLRRTKTDQEGQGRKVDIPYGSHPTLCPSMTPQTVRLVIVDLAQTAPS